MKKILIASTALVATAGVAAADVTVSGGARFGLQYSSLGDFSTALGFQRTGLEKRMTINLDASGETDGGMEFGGRIRIRSDEAAVGAGVDTIAGTADDVWVGGGTGVSGANVYIGMGGFRVTAGNIAGAIDQMPGLYSNGIGLTGLGWHGVVTNTSNAGYWGWDTFSSRGNGVGGVLLSYSAGDFAVHLSHGAASTYTAAVIAAYGLGATSAQNTALSGSYNFGDWTVAAGFQRDNIAAASFNDVAVLSVAGSFGDFGVNAAVSRSSNDLTNSGFAVTKIVLGGNYSMGDFSVNGFVGRETSAIPAWPTITTAGLGVGYDMGGATLTGGVSTRGPNAALGLLRVNQADFGVRISF